MSLGSISAWATAVRSRVVQQDVAAAKKNNTEKANADKVLKDIKPDPKALDTDKMAKEHLQSKFQGFDPKSVTAEQLAKYSDILKEQGLISSTTANLLSTAGSQKKPNEKFNALDYFANQISGLQNSPTKNEQFTNYMIPEYKRAINVLQNLQQFANSGASMSIDTKA
ncbi:hypothetical protein [Pseudomonas gingeri]|uniref:Uncharacterized protein n=1 Tax=Pseudomonas gingeri TaxID=117681 RepID=A0A7Y7YH43_9PSED|nr:hypothetical protein [Pseudomonas gingeri]NWA03579.1 hypothetical protein [Pseudomonas gingeri]NWA14437.1 hypothetical protein [Pseudomonas gingeri]NWA54945.1 hypothetical protein [Pseudomonas gingeri]NWA94669.1 hypothetical protein [Pseudomonas gingeri]NWB01325.1 hypothetical protein [Pseudomonas gingeri]